MSGEYRQMQRQDSEAAQLLQERLAREELGDDAYEKSVSYADDRSFKTFGVVFIVAFAMAVLGIAWLGY